MNREAVVNTILGCLRAVCKMKGIAANGFNASTALIGSEAVLDSLGLVLLLVQVEESLDTLHGEQTALVQRLYAEESSAETVGTLADRCLAIMGDVE